jgi:hypothetical protein
MSEIYGTSRLWQTLKAKSDMEKISALFRGATKKTETSSIYGAQLSRFRLKMEIKSSCFI